MENWTKGWRHLKLFSASWRLTINLILDSCSNITLLFIILLIFNRTGGLSRRLGPSRKLLFSHHRYSNCTSQRCSKEMPTARWGPRQDYIGHRKSVHLWPSSQAGHNHIVWSRLGLHRKADTKFYWADDTPLAGYTAWGATEPSSLYEKCGHMIGYGPRGGKWNDISCTFPAAFHPSTAPVILCQKERYLPNILGN